MINLLIKAAVSLATSLPSSKLQAFKSALDKNPGEIEVSVVVIFADRIAALGGDSFPGIVLADAGLSRPAQQISGAGVQISMELLEDNATQPTRH